MSSIPSKTRTGHSWENSTLTFSVNKWYLFNLQLDAKDGSAETVITMFEDTAEKIVPTTVNVILDWKNKFYMFEDNHIEKMHLKRLMRGLKVSTPNKESETKKPKRYIIEESDSDSDVGVVKEAESKQTLDGDADIIEEEKVIPTKNYMAKLQLLFEQDKADIKTERVQIEQ
ncbi:hypothetical protein Tco_0628266 [Tanacetum coccineum]|uniref:Replication factor A C-terminal domain-containing protein n=1 Tax=Tanacetum coccineum TaxID=301880 RepID=A0ABQ4WPT2_9ASTR